MGYEAVLLGSQFLKFKKNTAFIFKVQEIENTNSAPKCCNPEELNALKHFTEPQIVNVFRL